METARLDCWNAIVAKLPDIYRGSPESNELIQFRITAPDAAGKSPGKFTVANTSGQTLTDVTLVLELLHFATAPEPSVFEVCFIPEWQAGQEIRLAMGVEQNRECKAMDNRPVNADPARLGKWNGTAGVVRVAGKSWRAGRGASLTLVGPGSSCRSQLPLPGSGTCRRQLGAWRRRPGGLRHDRDHAAESASEFQVHAASRPLGGSYRAAGAGVRSARLRSRAEPTS